MKLLEEMKDERLQIMNLYFNSFGYKLFVDEIEEGIQFKTRGEKSLDFVVCVDGHQGPLNI